MENNGKCIWCNQDIDKRHSNGMYICICQNCKKYEISLCAFDDIPGEFSKKGLRGKEYLFAGYIREMNELGLRVETITNENFRNILSSSMIPKTTMEKLEKLLSFFYRQTKYLYHDISYDKDMPAIAYAKDSEELDNMVFAIHELNFIKLSAGRTLSLTLEGIQRAECLQKEVVDSKQCFIAMCFAPEILEMCESHIKQAIIDTGFQPRIIKDMEHNEDICDQIIAEIRRSKFLIADFTGNRGGVYYEAGFALGLGLPVIWTCKEDHLENVHFDVNHRNIIVWKTGEDLQKRLTDRIQATII